MVATYRGDVISCNVFHFFYFILCARFPLLPSVHTQPTAEIFESRGQISEQFKACGEELK